MKIDINKKYKTKDGREVRIYSANAGGTYPVHGAVLDEYSEYDDWVLYSWTINGQYSSGFKHDRHDLVEVVELDAGQVWIHKNSGIPHVAMKSGSFINMFSLNSGLYGLSHSGEIYTFAAHSVEEYYKGVD